MVSPADSPLPPLFANWFAGRGWSLRWHQAQLLTRASARRSALLIAPTGAGKTLAGFLPTLVELSGPERNEGLHTLYISPLKALAVDIARNLEEPVAEMGLPLRIEARTGDTPAARRQRQMRQPPQILLTTPEQVALMIANPEARKVFSGLRQIIVDELHALAPGKRGDLLALGLARLRLLAPQAIAFGLSATVAEPDNLRRWLVDQAGGPAMADLVEVPRSLAAPADLRLLETEERLPWAGHSARHAMAEIYSEIGRHRLTLVFVNTRMQAEFVFQALWGLNEENRRIALHHGSLDVGQRRKVEAAMAAGGLDAVVCTSTLDLGIDWGDVDLVINVGAPKGASRLLQRIGRANHRLDQPSKAYLVPSNRFEVLECHAAIEAARAGEQDAVTSREGALDVLAQHCLGMTVAEPVHPEALYREVTAAAPYAGLEREAFDRVIRFATDGGYALRAYDRFAKIRRDGEGRLRVANARIAQAYRMNVGTIVESTMLKVHLGSAKGGALRYGRLLGEIEEYFAEGLTAGDTFVFAGEVLRFEGIVEDRVVTTRAHGKDPMIPSYNGGKFPLSTHLAARVRSMLADPSAWAGLPEQVATWLALQQGKSALPGPEDLLVETFPRGGRYYLAAFPFEGRLAHQTLGMLLTRRLERASLQPLGFVANDYAIAIWMLRDPSIRIAAEPEFLGRLWDPDMLGDDLEDWLNESALMKRSFRACAVIAGLIERRFPGMEKKSRAVTMSTDLIFDVLRKHEPDHVLLKAARADAATGLMDLRRLSDLLMRIRGRIVHHDLAQVSPLSVPILLEIGKEPVYGEARDQAIADEAARLLDEMGEAFGTA
ncbi:ligase-associated DNA damage response DEXH box helicase [Rhabdaerophilum sp. SD176]|uniref:ligase-associated DNA damage response DEXH box helicase n=1 Tax=Rhabdaerophilum sp. SD176 TaxID=2983548 RepID=UPI0024DF379F|nr:ligase-associated DNA damage response DEXH box helicase [Rhabdaerophilum sp. SD176]